MKTLSINPSFRDLIPPLSDEERQMLERNLISDGCLNPIIVWGDTVVDGHNRYEICTRNSIKFDVVSKEFSDADEVADWIERNQLGRRNLTPDIFKLILGRRYNRQKKAEGRPEKLDQNEPVNPQSTAERLAAEHHVSPATVKRAAKFAEAVDAEPAKASAVMRGEKVEIPKKKDSVSFAERYEADEAPKKKEDKKRETKKEIKLPAPLERAIHSVSVEIDMINGSGWRQGHAEQLRVRLRELSESIVE